VEDARDQDVAMAVALTHVFSETTDIERLAEDYGAIFFKGASEHVVLALSATYDHKMPRLDKDLKRVDQERFIDKVTGKKAMLLGVETIATGRDSFTFKIVKSYGDVGGNDYTVEVNLIGQRWEVVGFHLGGTA